MSTHDLASALLLVTLTSAFLATARAQAPAPAPAPDPSRAASGGTSPRVDLTRGAGLQMLDGELWGGGTNYKVRFAADGFEFTPALGAAAPRNMPLRWTLESIGRGRTRVAQDAVAPAFDALRVEYARGGVRERYDVRPDGIEQSFAFEALPEGEGDLVVRGRIATDLQVTPDGDGLRLELPGVGGFRIGGVTGIDAGGRRGQGHLRCAGGILELSLPAAFVEDAALPLTLDPLFGSVFHVTSSLTARTPDVAYDATNFVYLVAWESLYSSSDSDVTAQTVIYGVGPVGNRIFVTAAPGLEAQPSVVNVNRRNAFVIAYTRSGDVLGRSVRADTRAVSAEITIAGGTGSQSEPDLAGEAMTGEDDALCVWLDAAQRTQTSVNVMQVQVNADWSLSLPTAPRQVYAPKVSWQTATGVAIAKSGGPSRRFAVAYAVQDTLLQTDSVQVVALNNEGVPIAGVGALTVAATAAAEASPDIDGDGDNWVVAWTSEAVPGSGDTDIMARSFTLHGGQLVLNSPIVTIYTGFAIAKSPHVCWVGTSCLVNFAYSIPGIYLDAIESVDMFSCADCEGSFSLSGAWDYDDVVAASALSGGSSREQALIASGFSTSVAIYQTGPIYGAYWSTADGAMTELAPACGDGGTAVASCARMPNAKFMHRLRGAKRSAPTALVLSASRTAWPCGACTLVPNPTGAIVVAAATDGDGNAAVPGPIPYNPALLGVPVYEQWLTLDPGSPSCVALSLEMSSAIEMRIE